MSARYEVFLIKPVARNSVHRLQQCRMMMTTHNGGSLALLPNEPKIVTTQLLTLWYYFSLTSRNLWR